MSAAAVAAIDAHLAQAGAPAGMGRPLRAEIAERVALRRPRAWNRRPRDRCCGNCAASPSRPSASELIRLWRENKIGDEVMRHQEEMLDYQEAQL
jgi:hypothetical protein